MLLAILALILDILDPREPIVISKETTLIVEPIAKDGLLDFAGAMLDHQRRDLDPDSNGAVKFWQAIGVDSIDESDREVLLTAINCEIDESQAVLQFSKDIDFLEKFSEEFGTQKISQKFLKSMHSLISKSKWQSTHFKNLTEWNKENEIPILRLHEASECKSYYCPQPNLLGENPDPILEATLYDAGLFDEVCNSLLLSASIDIVEEKRLMAYETIQACYRLSKLISKNSVMVCYKIGLDVQLKANDTLLLFIDTSEALQETQEVLDWLKKLREPHDLTGKMQLDSLMLIDAYVREFSPKRKSDGRLDRLSQGADINVFLRNTVCWINKHIDSTKAESRIERQIKLEEFVDDLNALSIDAEYKNNNMNLDQKLAILFDRKKRAELIWPLFTVMMAPNAQYIANAEDRAADHLRLMRTAAALKVWQLQQGSYPDSLNKLVPELLPKLPTCASWEKPLIYERRGDGFLLYAVGLNGVDDQANDEQERFTNGDYAPIDWFNTIPPREETGDDVVVRLPVPELNLPDPPAIAP